MKKLPLKNKNKSRELNLRDENYIFREIRKDPTSKAVNIKGYCIELVIYTATITQSKPVPLFYDEKESKFRNSPNACFFHTINSLN
ncbi:hypothetical protein BpHYR1_050441 [Brachionus plicatilis]|uniref:Uncharacterized protein n=1 Tax=Brachionus plicatilis TaxID=10195 RepID=A0A3M7R986_BRAPC|nr:hypothetical protein BpHYR1_050441 [Brachionus plicatilis]